IGVAFLAAGANRLPKDLRNLLLVGLAFDFVIGILLHLYLQNQVFEEVRDIGGRVHFVMAEPLSEVVWSNWRAKHIYHIVMIGDYLSFLKVGLFAALCAGAAIYLYHFARRRRD